jgi:hypothetical protein
MITFYDDYNQSLEGGNFSTFRKNLGNKLFSYAIARVAADILDCNLILPENPLVRRELFHMGYQNEKFMMVGIYDRKNIEGDKVTLDDKDLLHYKKVEDFINANPNRPIEILGYFTKYEYIKPYKEQIKSYYQKYIKPKRNNDDIIIMLRDSTQDARFVISDDYYINILENENFDRLYVSFDHCHKHNTLFQKLKKYNPIYLESGIQTLFSEVTSFNKIVASQGTFSFWACFLSNAEKIYWPITEDGPNSNNEKFIEGVNLIVDDEDRYKFVDLKNKNKT